jgi:hypothetical protein
MHMRDTQADTFTHTQKKILVSRGVTDKSQMCAPSSAYLWHPFPSRFDYIIIQRRIRCNAVQIIDNPEASVQLSPMYYGFEVRGVRGKGITQRGRFASLIVAMAQVSSSFRLSPC